MKLTSKDQEIVNVFFRQYVDRGYKAVMNAVRLSAEHTDEHRRCIFDVCNTLLKAGVPFWTEVRLQCGCIPDVVCPTHIKPIIEVLCSETPQMFEELKLHKYPSELQDTKRNFIFVDAKVPFEERCIW
jgi:hypothetical protein